MWISSNEAYGELRKRLAARHGHDLITLGVYYLPEVESTNTWIKELIASGGSWDDWSIVFTRHQTAGRGTRGRNWLQQAGLDAAVTCAMALGDDPPDPRTTLACGAATALVVEETTGSPAGIKWPNDVLLRLPGESGGFWAKVAGILTETIPGRKSGRHLIAGVGVNCNSRAAGFPADLRDRVTTLGDATGHPIDVCGVTERLVDRLVEVMHAIRGGDISGWLAEWERRDRTGGSRYLLNRGDRRIAVTAVRVELPTGNLIVVDDGGTEYTVASYTELAAPDE